MEHLLKHKLILATIAIQLVALPLILFAAKQQQETNTKATAGTTLSLNPSTASIGLGQEFSLDLMINPGPNLVSLAKIEIIYDPTKIAFSQNNNLVVNNQVFPQIVEGPIFTNGKVQLTISVGSDQSKVIQTPAKAITLNLKAIAVTNQTTVSFGTGNFIYSISSQDGANENVLSTTIPANITINQAPTSTLTPVPSNSPTPTFSPTPTITPTNTPTPTTILTPTPTTTPMPANTLIDFTGVRLHGLGKGGDSPNPNSRGTTNPLRPNRSLTVEIYSTSGTLVDTATGGLAYNGPQTGSFDGLITLPSSITNGNYFIKIKTPFYLRKQLPGFMTIVKDQSNTAPTITLTAGDVNGDNALSILDYEIIMGCYSDLLPAENCDATKKVSADISDDGKVNHNDYNLFLRELSVQQGD